MNTMKMELMEWLENMPSTKEVLAELEQIDVPDLDHDPEFVADILKGMATEDILRAMEEEGVNRSGLAERLGKSRQYVGRVLNENANFSLERLAGFACALDRMISVRIHRKDEMVLVRSLADHGLGDDLFRACDMEPVRATVRHVPPRQQPDFHSQIDYESNWLCAEQPEEKHDGHPHQKFDLAS